MNLINLAAEKNVHTKVNKEYLDLNNKNNAKLEYKVLRDFVKNMD